MSKTRNNHYVPQWYQKGFLPDGASCLHYLDLSPDQLKMADGRTVKMKDMRFYTPARCFAQRDLFTTFFGEVVNDDVETFLFGEVDHTGSRAVRAYVSGDAQ